MSYAKNKPLLREYLYDFSVDGGATGEIVLSTKDGYAGLPEGAFIKNVYAEVLTAVTSGGSATVSWGNSTDPDGYSGTAIAKASLTAGDAFSGSADSGALCPSVVGSASDDQNFSITVGTADLTAGKIRFYVEFNVGAVE